MAAGNPNSPSKMWKPSKYLIDTNNTFSIFHHDEYETARRAFYNIRSIDGRGYNRGRRYRSSQLEHDKIRFDSTTEENFLYADMIDADTRLDEMAYELNNTIYVLHRCKCAEKIVQSLVDMFQDARKNMFIEDKQFLEELKKVEFSQEITFKNSKSFRKDCKKINAAISDNETN